MKIQLDKYSTVPANQIVGIRSKVGVREITFSIRAWGAHVQYRPVGGTDWRFFASVSNDFTITVFTDDIEIQSNATIELKVSEGEDLEFETMGDSFVQPMSRNSIDPIQERLMRTIRMQQLEMDNFMQEMREDQERTKRELEKKADEDLRNRIAGNAIATASVDPVEPAEPAAGA